MRIALLQDEIFLPSLAGGTKANRCLLEGLTDAGHECLALTRAVTASPDGPATAEAFLQAVSARSIVGEWVESEVFRYRRRGLNVEALFSPELAARRDYLVRRIRAFRPDWVFVADDKRRFLLASGMAAAPGRCIPLLQTISQLPFGPHSLGASQQQTQLLRDAPTIIVISKYMQDYVREYAALNAELLYLPVYGTGPFPNLARHDRGFVTMINPCALKGISIFLALARACPHIEFAAVPTWGSDQSVLREIASTPNVTVLEPSDDIEDILRQTRILLAPSLWPETFGYVVPEAMVRGIPVLASRLGGLVEAKLGVGYLLPVAPAERRGGSYAFPTQDVAPWLAALQQLLNDPDAYRSCSAASRDAALQFVSQARVGNFERLLTSLAAAPT